MLAHDLASKSDPGIRATRGSKNQRFQGPISRTPFGSVLLIERSGRAEKSGRQRTRLVQFCQSKDFYPVKVGQKKKPPARLPGAACRGRAQKNAKEKSPPGNANGTTWRASFDLREEQIIGTQDEAQKLVAQRLLVILHCLDSTNSS